MSLAEWCGSAKGGIIHIGMLRYSFTFNGEVEAPSQLSQSGSRLITVYLARIIPTPQQPVNPIFLLNYAPTITLEKRRN